MANELLSLSELFQNRLFRIPDYQRGYAWKQAQLTDFWEDLMNLHEGKYHYTGLLSLKAADNLQSGGWEIDQWLLEMGYKAYHVVDGQQRLTTFSILMFQLVQYVQQLDANRDKQESDIYIGYESLKDIQSKYLFRKRPPNNMVTSYLFGYEADNPSADYLKYRVYEESFGGHISETYYTKNLKYAKSFFADNLKALYESEGVQGIEKLYKKLTLRLKFNLHEIEDDYDVFVAFETMNNRGKKLTNLELLKNRLIYLTTLFHPDELDEADQSQLRNNINDTWKEIYYQLGRNQNTPLSDDEFLRAHWITYFQYSRRSGNDYIEFLLNKFSAKNIYKEIVLPEEEPEIAVVGTDLPDEDEAEEMSSEPLPLSELAPAEIHDYVNSLKMLAEYWYYSFFPNESSFSDTEKEWIDKLNRVGISYFRPLVAVALATKDRSSAEERVDFFQAIERFIFLTFRIGAYRGNYRSSEFYNKARDLFCGDRSLADLTEDLRVTTDKNIAAIKSGFFSQADRWFDSGSGFYSWRDLRYFLYEYEYGLATVNNLPKIDWNLFAKSDRESVTIEHILPQTPTRWYWQNQFRKYTPDEIEVLSGSLGNLLPLAQSINSALQNSSFQDKKEASASGRRGYLNGSHSEIEVAREAHWTPETILLRGVSLLRFMEKRWHVPFTDDEILRLLHIDFVKDGRPEIPELPEESAEPILSVSDKTTGIEQADRHSLRLDFWRNFVAYCKELGREEIASRKPSHNDWYDVTIGSRDYHILFQLVRRKILRIGLYVYDPAVFARLESHKEKLENAYGSEFEWHTSREKSTAKRILHSIEADIHDPALYRKHFDWLIAQYDKLLTTLEAVDSEGFAKNEKETTGKITPPMTEIAYQTAKSVYAGELSRAEGIEQIVRLTQMNPGSAPDYIANLAFMLNGERYTRTMNEYTTRYYLEQIRKDYGEAAFQNALAACEKHAAYYAGLGHGQLAYVEKIVEELKGG